VIREAKLDNRSPENLAGGRGITRFSFPNFHFPRPALSR
jgi:hypothetical protein